MINENIIWMKCLKCVLRERERNQKPSDFFSHHEETYWRSCPHLSISFVEKVLSPVINFIHILQTAFLLKDPRSEKRHWWLNCLLVVLGSLPVKAMHKLVVEIHPSGQFHQHSYSKLLPLQMICQSFSISPTIVRPSLPAQSTRAQFHQCSKYSFYACRYRKRKKILAT